MCARRNHLEVSSRPSAWAPIACRWTNESFHCEATARTVQLAIPFTRGGDVSVKASILYSSDGERAASDDTIRTPGSGMTGGGRSPSAAQVRIEGSSHLPPLGSPARSLALRVLCSLSSLKSIFCPQVPGAQDFADRARTKPLPLKILAEKGEGGTPGS